MDLQRHTSFGVEIIQDIVAVVLYVSAIGLNPKIIF